MVLDPLPERRGLRWRRETLERERILRTHETLGIREGQCEDPRFIDGLLVRFCPRAPEGGDVRGAVFGEESIDRRHALGDDVLVVIGDDLELVLLPIHGETTL